MTGVRIFLIEVVIFKDTGVEVIIILKFIPIKLVIGILAEVIAIGGLTLDRPLGITLRDISSVRGGIRDEVQLILQLLELLVLLQGHDLLVDVALHLLLLIFLDVPQVVLVFFLVALDLEPVVLQVHGIDITTLFIYNLDISEVDLYPYNYPDPAYIQMFRRARGIEASHSVRSYDYAESSKYDVLTSR